VTGAAEPEQEESLEEIDNPIERLKLLAGNDEEIANYLDAIEVRVVRRMVRARTEPQLPRLVGLALLRVADELDRLVGQVLGRWYPSSGP
jgi:hypothetical protein